jgi:hypothetical protein
MLAAGLAVLGAVLAVTVPGGGPPGPRTAAPLTTAPLTTAPVTAAPATAARRGRSPEAPDRVVRVPVRIADAGVARLLRPGDRVDVLAASRVVAAGARVAAVPEDGAGALEEDGALVVLAVPRTTAAALTGAAVRAPLMVALT